MARLIIFSFLVCLFTLQGVGQVVDGVIGTNEYKKVYEPTKELKVYVSSTNNEVLIGIQSTSSGWFSIGLGSPRMDGAYMFVITTKDGTNYVIDEYIGVGHSHRTVKDKQVKSFAFSKNNDIVTVEFSIPNKLNNVELKGKVSGIWAISRDYKFGYHFKRGKLELEF
jgi:hypothetical protein